MEPSSPSNVILTNVVSAHLSEKLLADDKLSKHGTVNDKEETKWQFVQTFLVFMVFGAAPNWVFATALAQEIPYFEQHLPEGLCIATYMNAASNIGLLAVISYVTINYYHPIPQSVSVPGLLLMCVVGCFLTAFTYSITAFNTPVLLLVCCGIGGIVGALSAVVMSPFLMFYKNDYIR